MAASVEFLFYGLRRGGRMCLFLIFYWCAAVAGRCGGPSIVGGNSRFDEFNSRLGGHKFPFTPVTEFAGNGLIRLNVFATEQRLSGPNRKNSRYYGNNREFCHRQRNGPWHRFPTRIPICIASFGR